MVACDRDDWACQTHWDDPVVKEEPYIPGPLDPVIEFVATAAFEPLDWMNMADLCLHDQCSPWFLLALAPGIPGSGGKYADDIVENIDDAGNIVYRVIKDTEAPNLGLVATDLDARILPQSHVAGKKPSQWISTTKSIDVAKKYSTRDNCRVCQIDLSKVDSEIIDLSNGIPGMNPNTMVNRWAVKSQEVLIWGFIPSEAIINVWLPGMIP